MPGRRDGAGGPRLPLPRTGRTLGRFDTAWEKYESRKQVFDQRYDQMKHAVTSFWNDPSMQKALGDAKKNAEKARKAAAKKLG